MFQGISARIESSAQRSDQRADVGIPHATLSVVTLTVHPGHEEVMVGLSLYLIGLL